MSLQTTIVRRGRTYYFRLRVPRELAPEISRKELRRSLLTARPDEARRRGARCLVSALELFDALRQNPMLTKEEKIALVRRFYELSLDEDQQERRRAAGNLRARRRLAKQIDGRKNLEATIARELGGADFSRAVAATYDFGELTGTDTEAYAYHADDEFLEYLMRALLEKVRAQRARDRGDFAPCRPIDPLFADAASDGPASASPPATGLVAKPVPAIPPKDKAGGERARMRAMSPVALLPKFFAERTPSDESRETYEMVLRLFEQIVGAKPIASIARDDVQEFRDRLLSVPTNYRLRFKTDDVNKAIAMNEARGNRAFPTLSDKTINEKYLAFLRSFLLWGLDRGIAAPHLTDRIRVKRSRGGARQKPRIPYTTEQLRTIFKAPLFHGCKSTGRIHEPGPVLVRDWRFWIPILGLFTGCRLNELGQLRLDDVMAHGDEVERKYPHLRVKFAPDEAEPGERLSLKNVGSIRYVPLHPILVDLGFLDYVRVLREAGHKRVFPTWKPGKTGKYSNPGSKWFSRFLTEIGVKTKQLTFHSFRHTFIDRLRLSGIDKEYEYRICGHTDGMPSSIPTHWTAYGKEKLFEMGEMFTRVRFDDVDWSAVPRSPLSAPRAASGAHPLAAE